MIKNIFQVSDLSKEEIATILNIESSPSKLVGKNIGLLFEKYSTRTRLSFSVGIHNMGGNCVDLRISELNISRQESFEDTFKAFNCYLDGLIYRTTDHQKLLTAAQYFDKPIINALSDISHPCQTLSDLLTLKEQFGSLDINILWVGDMNNVCFSLVEAANLIPEINLVIFSPSAIYENIKWQINQNIKVTEKLSEIDLNNINCVMTDVFISMNDEDSSKKIDLLTPYMVNSDLMSKTAPNSVFMHCLPAKVGFEVSEEVFRSPQSIVWKQAYNRMVAQKKLLQFIYQ